MVRQSCPSTRTRLISWPGVGLTDGRGGPLGLQEEGHAAAVCHCGGRDRPKIDSPQCCGNLPSTEHLVTSAAMPLAIIKSPRVPKIDFQLQK